MFFVVALGDLGIIKKKKNSFGFLVHIVHIVLIRTFII